MIPGFLEEIEGELTEIVDDIDFADEDYAFNEQIDSLRNVARKIAVEAERLKLAAVKAA